MEQAAGRRWGARTGDQRRAARREALMNAAITLYGEIGYRNASVKAVCTAAGLTERYFYESFANSEALLHACFLQVTQALMERMRAAAVDDGPPPLERVRAGLLVYFTDLRKNPAAARVFLMEMASVSPAAAAVASRSLDDFGALLMEVLRGSNGGRPHAPLLLRGVVGGGLHIAQAWIESGYAAPIEDAVAAALRLYAVMDAT